MIKIIIITIKRYRYTSPFPDDEEVLTMAVVIDVVIVAIDVAEFREITLTIPLT